MTITTPSHALRSLIGLTILGALGTSFAPASRAANVPVLASATVKYGDLDLSTARGVAALNGRIRLAAEGICSPLEHSDFSSRMHKHACVNQVVADSVARVSRSAPTIMAAANSR